MQEKTVYDRLQKLVELADDWLRDRRLHQRVRAVSAIQDVRERSRERTRHNSVRYDLENFNYGVQDALKPLKHKSELLRIFDYIEIAYHDRTAANILELKMHSLERVIETIEQRPQRYIDATVKYSSNVSYDKTLGIISQSAQEHYRLKDRGKKLIDYLWGKRRQIFKDRTPTKSGRLISQRSVFHNIGIDEDELADVIDNFNAVCNDKHIEAKIRREKGNVILEVNDEYSTGK